jgi:hypothetical protein
MNTTCTHCVPMCVPAGVLCREGCWVQPGYKRMCVCVCVSGALCFWNSVATHCSFRPAPSCVCSLLCMCTIPALAVVSLGCLVLWEWTRVSALHACGQVVTALLVLVQGRRMPRACNLCSAALVCTYCPMCPLFCVSSLSWVLARADQAWFVGAFIWHHVHVVPSLAGQRTPLTL